MKLIVNMIQGFCMALADSVPGVSGGTIAFILGFYDEFIFRWIILWRGQKRRESVQYVFSQNLEQAGS